MLWDLLDATLRLPARALSQRFMRRAGIANTMALARGYNRVRYAGQRRRHLAAFRDRLDELLDDNTGPDDTSAAPVMRDGWALDRSLTLPHLGRLLDETAPLIAARAGKTHSSAQQPYFRNLMFPGDLGGNPSFLDFATSSSVLATVARYMKTIPVLSKTRPPGLRFMESSRALDPIPDRPYEESQLFHRDLHDDPVVYVLVALHDITDVCGPFTFLPRSVSLEATRRLSYRRWGASYRVPDEVMYDVIDPSQAVRFTGPRGSVLFIDSGACFHYGSRDAVVPRYQMMYAFTTPCRTDFSQVIVPATPYALGAGDSELRRLVLG